MDKILDIVFPTITTYTQHAHLLAILGIEGRAKPWIFSNYIQLYICKNLNEGQWADFYFPMPYETRPFDLCKWMRVQKNEESYVEQHYESIIEYITGLLDENYYVHMMVNYKYISTSVYYKKNIDRYHDVLVYGYDNSSETLYCADFMFNATKYSFSTCSFNDFIKAYDSSAHIDRTTYMNHLIYSYKIRNECDYEFHVFNILYWLKQYMKGEAPEYWNGYNYCNKEKIIWGINYYEALVESISSLKYIYIDVRYYHLLCDHKKIMVERLIFLKQYITNLDWYIEQYKEIFTACQIVENMIIKYNLTRQIDIIYKIVERIKGIKEKEYKVLNKLIDCIENNLR